MQKCFSKYLFFISVLLVFVSELFSFGELRAQSNQSGKKDLAFIFRNPPESAKPWVFWYWMKGAVTPEGIKTDLEAMKEMGLEGAYLVPIQESTTPPIVTPAADTFTPRWWEMLRCAFTEAERLGLKFTMHPGDGFATAGGTWNTPETSMQKVTWSQIQVEGGRLYADTLPQPDMLRNYYKEIAILAFPSPTGAGISTETVVPRITTSTGEDASFLIQKNGKGSFKSDAACWVQYEFAQPFTCRSIMTAGATYNYRAHNLRIETSDDGIHFKPCYKLSTGRNGWFDADADYTHSVPEITTRYFRFYSDKEGIEPGSDDNEMGKWKPTLKLQKLELSSAAVINQYEGKNGEIWRIAPKTPDSLLLGTACVPFDKIIDITDKFKDGKLTWQVPSGNWTIFRVGYTTTGHQNMTAGAGKGLECDKFNPVAVKQQFNNWYGEIRRQMGDDLTSKVLKRIHVDSWESGSQNWSPVFRAEFIKRRGYDPKLYLPAMAGIPVQDAATSEKFLYDVRQTISDLTNENFFGVLDSLGKKNSYEFSAESAAPVMSGDGMLHYKMVDVPMGEFWVNSPTHEKPTDMTEAVSGAHIYGKNIIQAEAFTTLRMDWNEYPGMLKPIGDRNFALGVNRFVFHVFTENPFPDKKPGMTLGPTGVFFQPTQTWWKPAKAWVDYTRRCQALLQFGKPVVDIAVFTGEELPRRAIVPEKLINTLPGLIGEEAVAREKKRLENSGAPMWSKPDGIINSVNTSHPADWADALRGYKYDSVNPDVLLNQATVTDGKLQLSATATYHLLVLPQKNTMMPDTTLSDKMRKQIDKLKQQGIKVIRYWDKPTLDALGIERDVIVKDNQGKVIGDFAWNHRTAPGIDIYFIANQQTGQKEITLSLRVSGRVPEIWNPVTGEICQAGKWVIKNGRTELPLRLDANESLFIVLQTQTKQTGSAKGANWIETKTVQTLPENWSVQFDPSFGGPKEPMKFSALTDWTASADPAVKYYSGTALYSSDVEINKIGKGERLWLDLGRVEKIAEVKVNGVSCGIAWTSPYQVEISKALKPGKNKIEVAVSSTWINRLIGDSLLPEKQRIAYTFNPIYRLDDKKITPSGLIGPVRVLSENKPDLSLKRMSQKSMLLLINL
jgi:hypothetical protein